MQGRLDTSSNNNMQYYKRAHTICSIATNSEHIIFEKAISQSAKLLDVQILPLCVWLCIVHMDKMQLLPKSEPIQY